MPLLARHGLKLMIKLDLKSRTASLNPNLFIAKLLMERSDGRVPIQDWETATHGLGQYP